MTHADQREGRARPGAARHRGAGGSVGQMQMGRHTVGRPYWRLLVVLLVVLSVAAASWAVSWSAARRAVPTIATIHVTCQDRSTDAARLQDAIDSSPVGAAIEFQGGTCLLTRGLTLLSDRTYTGGSTTGTVLRQAGSAGYVLASSAYADGATSTGDPLTIRDLTVACDGSGSTDGIIVMNWQVEVEYVDVSGCRVRVRVHDPRPAAAADVHVLHVDLPVEQDDPVGPAGTVTGDGEVADGERSTGRCGVVDICG